MHIVVLCANATVGAFDKAQLICTVKGIPSGAIITVDWRRGGSTAAGGTAVIIKNDSNHLVTLQGHRTTMTIHEVG